MTSQPEPNWLEGLRDLAREEGFVEFGIAPAVQSVGFSDLVRWIESGYAGSMHYIADRLDAYRHPRGVLPGAKSIIVLMLPYHAGLSKTGSAEPSGRIARYAWQGSDYHDVVHPKLKRLCRFIRAQQPESSARGIIDTAPLMEREVAQLAGLGWRGKNTLLLNKRWGSYFFLACVLVDIELPPDQEHDSFHCGTCTACLDACPTDAFVKAGVLDATRCISYHTIESKSLPERQLSDRFGDWLFGCDVCQEVCPWNRKRSRSDVAIEMAEPRSLEALELIPLFSLDDESFRELFRKTPLWRGRRRGLLRNAAFVIGNLLVANSIADETQVTDAIDALQRGSVDSESLVRAASVRSLRRLTPQRDLQFWLTQRRKLEKDPMVLEEFPGKR